jgi:DNA ligase (NAD+)
MNEGMEIKKLLTFFQELECPHLGPKTIEVLYNNGFETVFDLLNLTKQDLLNTDKFKDKSAENVLSGIQIAKDFLYNINNSNLHILMYASGSFGFGFGSKKIKMILDIYPNIIKEYEDKNRDEWIENIKSVKGISEQAESFVDNINKYKNFIKTINTYIKFIDESKQQQKDTKKDKDTKSKKENIVLTGFRDKYLKKLLEENGHIVNDNVTKETTIVVYNEDDSSSKCQKAKKMGIKLIHKTNILSVLNINI